MRSIIGICLAASFAAMGCTTTALLNETTPVFISGQRPAPPPPEEPPPPPPPPPRVEVEESRIRVDEKIHFETDRWEIRSDSDGLLQEIARVMNDNPRITRIRIEGHTDNQGSPRYNRGLSDRRANSVLERLVENGVARERLEAQGFGLTRPVADNDTREGRAENRRVEFNIVDQTGAAAPAPAPEEPEGGASEGAE